MQGDDSAEVNLSFELKGKMLEVDAIRILNFYFLSLNLQRMQRILHDSKKNVFSQFAWICDML